MLYKFIQEHYNEQLVSLLKKDHIKKLRLLSVGNSIASGYSFTGETKPLLDRNETLPNVLDYYHIEYEPHQYSRAQNNNDEHLFEWLVSNIRESRIHDMNVHDYTSSEIGMPTKGLNERKIEEYYPRKMRDDLSLQDALKNKTDDVANIVIYNGCTGSFLDAINRGGSFKQQLLHGIRRDAVSIESILKWIQFNNRKGNSNTQVYLCGVPDIMGLKIGEIINHYLRKIAQEYANVVYVPPVKTKFLYRDGDKIKADVHYNDMEYYYFMNQIMDTIFKNYDLTKSMIQLDREFYQLSRGREFSFPELQKKEVRTEYMEKSINRELKNVRDKKEFLKRIKKYILGRFPYDFYYLGKDDFQNSYKKVKKDNL